MAVDLDAYFRRIGYAGDRAPTLTTLRAIHALHPAAIPFESLDPLMGRPVRLDLASLEAKLVAGWRGGYCFEQNGIFLRVLRSLGYQVFPLAARVRWMAPADAPPGPLSHMLLMVDLPQGRFLCDVGFGGQSPTAPLRFEAGREQATPHGDYRIQAEADGFDLQLRLPERWATLYRFTLEPRLAADYEVSNWYTSTHPGSTFTSNLIASRVSGPTRLNLFNRAFTTHDPETGAQSRQINDAAELHTLLAGRFGVIVELEALERVFPRLPTAA